MTTDWCTQAYVPVGQSQNKQLQEGGVDERVLVISVELGEAWDAVRPGPRHLHGAGQQAVEELDLLSLRQTHRLHGAELQTKQDQGERDLSTSTTWTLTFGSVVPLIS